MNTLLGVSSKTSGSSTTFYIRDNDGHLVYQQLPSGLKDYYLFDAKGSVTGLVNSTGSLVGSTAYTYDPYGNLTQGQTSVDNPWLFQGQYSLLEDQGSNFSLYHMGARYDQPGIERWTQQDPNVSGKSPLDQNRYLFTADDPVNHTDPTGLQQDTCSETGTLAACSVPSIIQGGGSGIPINFSSLLPYGIGLYRAGSALYSVWSTALDPWPLILFLPRTCYYCISPYSGTPPS